MGVYVNDLNLHDSSRELILAGTQQSAELQLALDQVMEKPLNPLSAGGGEHPTDKAGFKCAKSPHKNVLKRLYD